MTRKTVLVGIILFGAMASGCASYRVSSNTASSTATSLAADTKVVITEDSLPGYKYHEIGPVEVSVKKLTVFHKNPTKTQANEALADKARAIGADAVINVKYKSGVGLTTWGYMDASGTGVKLEQ